MDSVPCPVQCDFKAGERRCRNYCDLKRGHSGKHDCGMH
jgi:hypothetical protein